MNLLRYKTLKFKIRKKFLYLSGGWLTHKFSLKFPQASFRNRRSINKFHFLSPSISTGLALFQVLPQLPIRIPTPNMSASNAGSAKQALPINPLTGSGRNEHVLFILLCSPTFNSTPPRYPSFSLHSCNANTLSFSLVITTPYTYSDTPPFALLQAFYLYALHCKESPAPRQSLLQSLTLVHKETWIARSWPTPPPRGCRRGLPRALQQMRRENRRC